MSGTLPPSLHTDKFYYKYYQNNLHKLTKINFVFYVFLNICMKNFQKVHACFSVNIHALQVSCIIRASKPYQPLLYKH